MDEQLIEVLNVLYTVNIAIEDHVCTENQKDGFNFCMICVARDKAQKTLGKYEKIREAELDAEETVH